MICSTQKKSCRPRTVEQISTYILYLDYVNGLLIFYYTESCSTELCGAEQCAVRNNHETRCLEGDMKICLPSI